ncbi:MAG: QcrA and Rieske domain-containing protein [Acidimicrobiales bacterium]
MVLGPWDVVGIVVGGVLAAAAVLAAALRARRETGGARSAAPCPPPATAGPTSAATAGPAPGRRRFLEQGVLGVFAAALVGVVTSASDYVATASGRRGRTFSFGSADALRTHLRTAAEPYYDPVGGFYVVAYPAGDLAEARLAYRGTELAGMEAGFVALDQTCTHLGCRVPFCRSSRWFECPCHGSRFNAVGELRRGPAPRGLDRYPIRIEDGTLVVDTNRRIFGPAPGTDTTGQRPAGPHCS